MLYSAGGVIGTMHHLYFSRHAGRAHGAGRVLLGGRGDPADVPDGRGLELPAARGARRRRSRATPFPHRWAVMFLVAVGFWNFLGAGIFGFLINLPIVSYYEIGTALTANHGHAAMMGVYGMLAVGAGAVLPALPDPRRSAGPSGPRRSASGRSTSGSPGWCSRRCSRSASCSSTSPSTTATSRRGRSSSSPPHQHRASSGCACRATSCSSSAGYCRCSTCAGSACVA